jgi:hypothetical protein
MGTWIFFSVDTGYYDSNGRKFGLSNFRLWERRGQSLQLKPNAKPLCRRGAARVWESPLVATADTRSKAQLR